MLLRVFRLSLFVSAWLVSLEAQSQHSVARQWNEALLDGIRKDLARPTVHARNLFHISVVMYDAWAVYDKTADPWLLGNEVGDYESVFDGFTPPGDIESARKETRS